MISGFVAVMDSALSNVGGWGAEVAEKVTTDDAVPSLLDELSLVIARTRKLYF